MELSDFKSIFFNPFLFILVVLTGITACNDNDSKPPVETSLLDKLNQIESISANKKSSPFTGYQYYELWVEQPLDHDQPNGETFSQRVRFFVKDVNNPVVLHTAGYFLSSEERSRLLEPTTLFDANQLDVEHRFFGESVPNVTEWDYLNIRQASADLHKIVTLIKPIFGGKWLTSGHSKGGMTATFHRRFYPEDVDGTLAYAAPLFLDLWDERFAEYTNQVVSAECIQAYQAFQREALDRIDELTPMFEQWAANNGFTIAEFGYTPRQRMEAEIAFSWIYVATHIPDMGCGQLPPMNADTQTYFDIFKGISYFSDSTVEGLTDMLPYHLQAAAELGNYSVPLAHIEDQLSFDVTDFDMLLLGNSRPAYRSEVMTDIVHWAEAEASGIIFIYGKQDYTTAAPFPIANDESRDLQLHIASGLHSITIESLPAENKSQVLTMLEKWLK